MFRKPICLPPRLFPPLPYRTVADGLCQHPQLSVHLASASLAVALCDIKSGVYLSISWPGLIWPRGSLAQQDIEGVLAFGVKSSLGSPLLGATPMTGLREDERPRGRVCPAAAALGQGS